MGERLAAGGLALVIACGAWAQEPPTGHRHHARPGGMVMNANDSVLPRDCTAIRGDYRFEVEAGAELASARPGQIFAYSLNEFRVEPCSRITVRFANRDAVRHQWMVHGLPRYLYPGGMFHLEADGGASVEGTFIIPSDQATYLVHCDIAQHMEKGMKAQLVAGGGDLWAVPGVSAPLRSGGYRYGRSAWLAAPAAAFGLLFAWLMVRGPKRPSR